jgi:hypothetical protein
VNARRLTLALALIFFGVATDRVLRGTPGIGMVLLAVGGAALVVVFARPRRWGLALLGAALLVTSFAAVRASFELVAFDLMIAAGLAIWAASFAQGGDPVTTRTRAWLERGFRVFGSLPDGVRSTLPPVRLPNRPKAGVAIRTIAIAGFALLVFGGILASADPVFAQIVTTPFRGLPDVTSVLDHGAMIVFAAVAAGVLVAYAGRSVAVNEGGTIRAGFEIGPGEWTVVVGVVALLFAAFVAVQFPALFGGHTHVLDEIGLTYADYARGGFAQMVLAAALTLGLIGLAWIAGAAGNRTLRGVAIALIALDRVVLVSAFRRLALYEDAFGWTHLRLFGHVFIIWLAIALICVGVALALGGVKWLVFAGLAAGLVAVVGVNLLNPDAFIARHNLARTDDPSTIDVGYLGSLSEDALPTLVAAFPSLTQTQQRDLIAAYQWAPVCRDDRPAWWSFNLARDRAREVFGAYC